MEVYEIKVICPVCNDTMSQKGNPKIHYCPPRKINFPTFKQELEISHASVYLNDLGVQTYAKIISDEYSFEIFGVDEFSSTPKTIIKKLQRTIKSSWDHSVDVDLEFIEFLTVNATVDLPWNDHSKVKDAIKTYLLFS